MADHPSDLDPRLPGLEPAAQRDLLDGVRPVAGDRVLLGARQHPLAGAADVFGGQRRDEDVDPRPQRRAERAADKWRHHVHVVFAEAERGGEKNFASTFPVLDLMFGTFYMPKNELPDAYGIADRDFPASFSSQLLYPFRQ